MPMLAALQDLPAAPHSPVEQIAAAAIIVIQIGTVVLSHLKGKKGSVNMDGKLSRLGQDLRLAIDTRCDTLSDDVGGLRLDIQAVKGTVETVASDVKGLKDRELARLEADAAPTRQARRKR